MFKSSDIPEGYELIKEGEVIREGDLFWCGGWHPRQHHIGSVFKNGMGVTVRMKPKGHGLIPEGYELVKAGDYCAEGDLFWAESCSGWTPRTSISFGDNHTATRAVTIRKNPVVTTMDHQDGATTTTVRVGRLDAEVIQDPGEIAEMWVEELRRMNRKQEIASIVKSVMEKLS